MELRGFDSYDITLGDEMRGERASMGKSLEDAEHELRIKARMITAIEDCDLTGFTNQSVIAGYVRSYARYLGMDPEDCYQRFCEESGYRSPAALMSASGDGSAYKSLQQRAVTSRVGAQLGQSRFAAPPSQNRFRARISLGALTSTFALLALIGGLGYGGYALLQDIQRVGFAPLPEAPTVVANAPEFEAPQISPVRVARPSASDYEGGGALAVAPPLELIPAPHPRRDGPISAIDPAGVGIFAPAAAPPELSAALDDPDSDIAAGGIFIPEAAAAEPEPAELGVVLHASGTAWIKISERDNSTIWQGTLESGQSYRLPEHVVSPIMRTGNAGNTFVIVDGVAYGPLGRTGEIAKNISLVAEDVRTKVPEAEPTAFRMPDTESVEHRAEAQTTGN